MSSLRSRSTALLVTVLALAAWPLEGAPLRPAAVFGETEVLFKITDIAVEGERVVVLTESAPAVHVFHKKSRAEWGKKGQGPGELESPAAVALDGQKILVVEGSANRGKIVTFDAAGKFLAERPLPKPQLLGLLQKCSDTFLIQGGDFGGKSHVVLSLGPKVQEVLKLQYEPLSITLRPKQGPSVEVHLPAAPAPKWTCLADGRLAYWDGAAPELELRNLKGERLGGLRLPTDRIAFEKEDRNAWLLRQFPKESEFQGQRDFFRHAREEGARVLPFPKFFPALERVLPDPKGGAWILRAAKHSGEIWTLLRETAPPRTVTFPPGRRVWAFGDVYVAAKVVDELGVETVELYRRRDVLPEEAGKNAGSAPNKS